MRASLSQECVYFEEEYICADTTCDPSPCADNEYCNVEKWDCTQEPCPTIAFCRDACNGECGEGEVCELTDEVACIQQPCPSLPQCVPVEEEGECDIECGEYQVCVCVCVFFTSINRANQLANNQNASVAAGRETTGVCWASLGFFFFFG